MMFAMVARERAELRSRSIAFPLGFNPSVVNQNGCLLTPSNPLRRSKYSFSSSTVLSPCSEEQICVVSRSVVEPGQGK